MKASVFSSILFVVITACSATNARRRIGGTYGCETVGSRNPVRVELEGLQRRSSNGESCRLEDIRNATIPLTRSCTGIMLSDRIGLTSTTCISGRTNRKATCDIGDGFQVIRHQLYYSTTTGLLKHDIAVFGKYKATASDLNCVQHKCKGSTKCKIISKNGMELDVSLAYCADEDHPDSGINVSSTNPNDCHTMCVKRRNNKSIPRGLFGSPLICRDESRLHEDNWFIRGIISFMKSGHNEYAMAAMMDKSVFSNTACDCPSQ